MTGLILGLEWNSPPEIFEKVKVEAVYRDGMKICILFMIANLCRTVLTGIISTLFL